MIHGRVKNSLQVWTTSRMNHFGFVHLIEMTDIYIFKNHHFALQNNLSKERIQILAIHVNVISVRENKILLLAHEAQ